MVAKAKHLQFVSGMSVTVYWLAHLAWDYIICLMSASGVLLTLLASQQEGLIEPETQGADHHHHHLNQAQDGDSLGCGMISPVKLSPELDDTC